MANITIDRATGKVTGVDRAPLSFEKEIIVPEGFTVKKTVQEAQGKIQKVNADGDALYMDNIVLDEFDQVTSFTEVTTAQKPTAFETVTKTYKVVNADGSTSEVNETVQEPTAFEDLPPVLVDNIVDVHFDFKENIMNFTEADIVKAKVDALNASNLNQVAFFSEDLDAKDFATGLSTHEADMGVGVIAVHGLGQVRTNKIPLGKSTDTIQLHLEATEGIKVSIGATTTSFVPVDSNGIAKLASATTDVYVLFENTASTKRDIHAFGLLV